MYTLSLRPEPNSGILRGWACSPTAGNGGVAWKFYVRHESVTRLVPSVGQHGPEGNRTCR